MKNKSKSRAQASFELVRDYELLEWAHELMQNVPMLMTSVDAEGVRRQPLSLFAILAGATSLVMTRDWTVEQLRQAVDALAEYVPDDVQDALAEQLDIMNTVHANDAESWRAFFADYIGVILSFALKGLVVAACTVAQEQEGAQFGELTTNN